MAENWDSQKTGHAKREPENIQPDDVRDDRIMKAPGEYESALTFFSSNR